MKAGPPEASGGRAWVIGVTLLIAAGIAARLVTLPQAPDVDDSILFVNGVIRFAISEARPHWPGYPVYIWAGKLMAVLVHDPVRALHLVSALSSALVAWPLAFVARSWALAIGTGSRRADAVALASAALWLVTPMAWVTGSQIFSDFFGLLIGVTLLALGVAAENGRPGRWVLAALAGGLLVGVRLVNVTMLVPLLWAAWHHRGERWHGWRMPVAIGAAFLLGVVPWAVWLIVPDVGAFIQGARYHMSGHFRRWGESVLTDERLLERPLRAASTLLVYGLGGGTLRLGWCRLFAGLGWAGLLLSTLRLRPWRNRVAWVVALWAVPNLTYVFLGHDVTFPRYMLSVVANLAVLAGLGVAAGGWARRALALATVVLVGWTSASLAALQHRQTPVEDQVTQFLIRQPRAAVVIVDLLQLPLFLENAGARRTWVIAPAADVPVWRKRWEAEGWSVFSTSPPPGDVSGWRPVAHFCRDPLIDPRYGRDAWLFVPVASIAGGAELVDYCEAE